MAQNTPDILLCTFRHGDTMKDENSDIICGQSNTMPLTPRGEARSKGLGLILKDIGLNIDIVEVSPALRSKETARIALEAAGIAIEVIESPEIHEISQGEWEGQSRKQYGQAQREGIAKLQLDFRAPGGGESLRDIMLRTRRRRQRFVELQEAMRRPLVVVAFGHGLTTATEAGDINGWTATQIGGLKVPNNSVTTELYSEGVWRTDLIAAPARELTKYVS